MFMQQLFLLIGELADFKIGNRETDWERRTFRGSILENEVAEHFDDWNLRCEYKKILVNNNDEHNDAFELLEMWLDNNFKKYKKVGLVFMYEKVKDNLIEDNTIDSIEELWGNCVGDSNQCRDDFMLKNRAKINELVRKYNKLNKEIKEVKEK